MPERPPTEERVDLPAREMHVRRLDQAPLVAGQRHPLGQHVVGVREPRAAVRARLVRERDAVLVEQPAGLRDVADDRLVGIDEIGVRRAAEVVQRAVAEAAPHPQEAEVAGGGRRHGIPCSVSGGLCVTWAVTA